MRIIVIGLIWAALSASARGQALEESSKPYRKDGLPIAPYAPNTTPGSGPSASSDGIHRLEANRPVDQQLASWAARSQWTFKWYSDVSWRVIAPSTFEADFEKSFIDVMDILIHDEGKPLRYSITRANRVVEVFSNDLR